MKSFKKSILLIPSTNGIGHARRLIHYVKSWDEFHTVFLLLSEEQRFFLEEEVEVILAPKYEVKILVYGGIGIDGYRHQKNPNNPEMLDIHIQAVIKYVSVVISDNCIWPLFFRSDCILVGHFLWHDVLNLNDICKSGHARRILTLERKLLEKAKTVFGITRFSFGKLLELSSGRNLALPVYCPNKPEKRRNDQVWYSTGTTGFNQINIRKWLDPRIVIRESFKLETSEFLPNAILGRPGLGTIRDSIEWGVPFGPLYSSQDFELQNNVAVISKLRIELRSMAIGGHFFSTYLLDKNMFIGEVSWSQIESAIQ